MYEKYLAQLEEAGKIRNLKERSITCYKNYVFYFLKYQNKDPEELTCQDDSNFSWRKRTKDSKLPEFATCSKTKLPENMIDIILLEVLP